jgi:hypothetical protein
MPFAFVSVYRRIGAPSTMPASETVTRPLSADAQEVSARQSSQAVDLMLFSLGRKYIEIPNSDEPFQPPFVLSGVASLSKRGLG